MVACFPGQCIKIYLMHMQLNQGLAIIVTQALDLPKPQWDSQSHGALRTSEPWACKLEPSEGDAKWADSLWGDHYLQHNCKEHFLELDLYLKLGLLAHKQVIKSYPMINTPTICWILFLSLPKVSLILTIIL